MGKMMGAEEAMENIQSLTINTNKSMMRRTKTTRSKRTISKPTTRTKAEAEPEPEDDARTGEEQGQEDCMNHQPGSLEQELE